MSADAISCDVVAVATPWIDKSLRIALAYALFPSDIADLRDETQLRECPLLDICCAIASAARPHPGTAGRKRVSSCRRV
jgi:hypothetical protein